MRHLGITLAIGLLAGLVPALQPVAAQDAVSAASCPGCALVGASISART